MVLFIRINKDGDLSEENLDDIDNLYKKCNLRKQEGFVKLYSYTFNNEVIELWGRNEGRNNIKNKFVFEFKNELLFILPIFFSIGNKDLNTVPIVFEAVFVKLPTSKQ